MLPEDVGPKSQRKFSFSCVDCGEERRDSPGNVCRAEQVICWKCGRGRTGISNQSPRSRTVMDSPELLALWDFQRNLEDPGSIAYKSNRKFYWLCEFGHSTFAAVFNRESNRRGCGVCMEKHHVSKGERELASFISSIYGGRILLNSRSAIHPYELDIFLPDISVALEFNGSFYHSERFIREKSAGKIGAREQHERKRSLAAARGLSFGIVWESDWYGPQREGIELAVRGMIFDGSLESILDKMTIEDMDDEEC